MSVISVEPAFVLARMVNAVDADNVTTIDAVPLPLNSSARPPDAVPSETERLTVDGVTVILSASMTGAEVGAGAGAAAGAGAGADGSLGAGLLADVREVLTAVSFSRRTASAIVATTASAGTVGTTSEMTESEAMALPTAAGNAAVAAEGVGIPTGGSAWRCTAGPMFVTTELKSSATFGTAPSATEIPVEATAQSATEGTTDGRVTFVGAPFGAR